MSEESTQDNEFKWCESRGKRVSVTTCREHSAENYVNDNMRESNEYSACVGCTKWQPQIKKFTRK